MTASEQSQIHAWHAQSVRQVLEQLGTREVGLSQAEAAARLEKYGPNRLPQQPPPALWKVVLRQFRSPLIYILGAAAIVSAAMGGEHLQDAGFIAGVLVLNAIIGSWQEWKAEKSSHALRKLLQIRAAVVRDGEVSEINAEEVVPGDVVWLESGNRVPADIRLLSAHGLEVDESLLTGESLPVHKDPAWTGEPETAVADRLNMAHAGSVVTRGRAKGVVVATGTSTSVGQVAQDVLGGEAGKPPLLVRMERFTNVIAIVILIAAAVIGTLGFTLGGYTPTEMFLFAVALAVSAIPEGLPVAMTVALAVATTRMARRGVIVRRLTAVEGLGSCTFVATDKTGTLTCNELTVQQVRLASGEQYDVTGEGFAPQGQVLANGKPVIAEDHASLLHLVRASILCNEADLHHRDGEWVWRGDAVDIALLSLGEKLNQGREASLDQFRQVNEIPFEPEQQFAATFHAADGETVVFAKGAPERILAMCDTQLDSHSRERAEQMAVRMAKEGFRVLAIAEGRLGSSLGADEIPPEPANLRFLGLVGMIDPLRPGAREAVETCHQAGITVSMVTGDHQVTALAIARDLDLAHDEKEVITGAELVDKSPEELAALAARIRVFARVAPHQKLQIVKASQEAGHFVAVTGDGVNDAPALRTANIGVAMGRSGTDVAREASEMVITDDNFATIVAGVEEGRVAYDNIRKVIYLLISTGAAELVLMAMAVATGMPYLPLLPVQILWLNLVTNGIQDVALAFEPSEGGVLNRKPRPPRERIFNQLMIERTAVAALVMGLAGFFTFRWLLPEGASETDVLDARNALLLLMVLFENVHIGNCRSETKSALLLSPLRSPILLAGAITALSLHVVAMYLPWGQAILGTAPLGWSDWLVLLSIAVIIFPSMELHKLSWWWRHRPQAETTSPSK